MSTHKLGPPPESVERAIRKFGMECVYGDHAARVFGALQIREEMKAYALAEVARAVEAERAKFPNLMPVIQWLENGCDPKEAAKELRFYQAKHEGAR